MLKVNSVYTKKEILKGIGRNDVVFYFKEDGTQIYNRSYKLKDDDELFLKTIEKTVGCDFGSTKEYECKIFKVVIPNEVYNSRF